MVDIDKKCEFIIKRKEMFSKLLGSTKAKADTQDKELSQKIQKMDLLEMRVYVNGKLTEYEVNEFGLYEVVKKLLSQHEKTSKYYIDMNDMDSKKKKAFDLLLLVLKQKEVSVTVVELAQKFLEVYEELIKKYDYDHKQIYEKKIKSAISNALAMIEMKSDINEKMRVTK